MASFYAERGRTIDADNIIEEVCQCHVAKFRVEHRHTQQLILQIVELLNAWKRETDALAFLSRAKDLAEGNSDVTSSAVGRAKSRRKSKTTRLLAAIPSSTALGNVQQIIAGNDPSRMDEAVGIARERRMKAKDEAVEAFLKAIIAHCHHHVVLELQELRARRELLQYYNNNNFASSFNSKEAFLSAAQASRAVIGRQKWNKKSFKGFEIMEALLELAASILKGRLGPVALDIFQRIEHKADDDFGWDDERTIWAKLSIGIIYQRHKSWEHAKPWFDHALAASVAANGDEDGITAALEVAMERRHFSYLSDEGRPFKSIFGVTGLTIRPTRLHLD
jgi:hypothetical protein